MFQQIDTQPYDVLSHGCSVPGRPANRTIRRTSCGGVIADREVPLFALLRSTQGLPVDDRRWWPERPVRRRDTTGAEVGGVDDVFAPGRHTLVVGGVFPTARELSTPTVALLERTLAGLRAWDTAVGADPLRTAGRHELALTGTVAPDDGDALSPR